MRFRRDFSTSKKKKISSSYRPAQLRLGRVPLPGGLERDVRRCVVHDRERRHPEVVAQPGGEPVLEHGRHPAVADPSPEVADRRDADEREQRAGRQRDQHARPLLLGVEVEVEVPDGPVPDRGPQLQGRAQEELVQSSLDRPPLLDVGFRDRVPGGVLDQLVGVRVVVVVLDPSGSSS